MSYQLIRHRYHADIVELETGRTAARVYITERHPYPVCDHQGQLLFATSELDEVLAKFERDYTNHEPPWEPVYTSKRQQGLPGLFLKRTRHGELRVQRDAGEQWIALLDGIPLFCRDGVARFGSCGFAQAVAEKNILDWHAYGLSDQHEDEHENLDRRIERLFSQP